MFCPRCGQQQVSDETRFCSRCGLPIAGLAEWVAGGVPAVRAQEPQVSPRSPRRKGMRRGAKLMFWGAVLFPVLLILSLAADEPAPLLLSFLLFFVGLALLLHARIFGEETEPAISQPARAPGLGAMQAGGALPPASDLPTYGAGGRPVRTAELVRPPSVTENTTKLLDKE